MLAGLVGYGSKSVLLIFHLRNLLGSPGRDPRAETHNKVLTAMETLSGKPF